MVNLKLWAALLLGAASHRPPVPSGTGAAMARFHAPILFQDTEVLGETQGVGRTGNANQPIQRRGDFITRIDFDGNWNGLDNWAASAKPPPPDFRADRASEAVVYYSVVETETHAFLFYMDFHPQDREPKCKDRSCHENDFEGGLHLVRKGPENGGMGTLWLVMYNAHDNWSTHLTQAGREAGIREGGKPPHDTAEAAHHGNKELLHGVVWRGLTPDGSLWTPADPLFPGDPGAPKGTVFHPTVWSEPWGHGMYGWPGPSAVSPLPKYRFPDRPWKDGFINGDGVVYVPGERAQIPDFRKETDQVTYKLVDLFERGGLWERRDAIDRAKNGCVPGGEANCTFAFFGTFRGEAWGTDKASVPWGWDHGDDHAPPGAPAFDPLVFIEQFNDFSQVPASAISRTYTKNGYLGIPIGTRPGRPLPVAVPSERLVVAKPHETFVLDASLSKSGDLGGKGQLWHRWDSSDPSWGAETWSRSPQTWKTVSRPGRYPVKLSVNDGDHTATDSLEVVVSDAVLFFDDFQAPPKAGWDLIGPGWRSSPGLLVASRPGGPNNIARLTSRSLPPTFSIEASISLSALYPEASVPFGVGIGRAEAPEVTTLFGFVGTTRVDSGADPSRRHLSEVAFVSVRGNDRAPLGPVPLVFDEKPGQGFALNRWYRVKVGLFEKGRVKAKVWPQGETEPPWKYEVTATDGFGDHPVPLLVAGAGTSGEAMFSDVWVSRGEP